MITYRVSVHVQEITSDANRTKIVIGSNRGAIISTLSPWMTTAFQEIEDQNATQTAELISPNP